MLIEALMILLILYLIKGVIHQWKCLAMQTSIGYANFALFVGILIIYLIWG